MSLVKRPHLKCQGTGWLQVKSKPGRTWTNKKCPGCDGTGWV